MIAAVLLAATQTVLTVFAASSLHAALPEVAKSFKLEHADVDVRFSFGGSQLLEAQLVQGAPADLYVSADPQWMKRAVSDNVTGAPVSFISNTLVVAASKTSPVQMPEDLAKPGLRIVMCAETVPCGRYARDALTMMSRQPHYGSRFSDAVMRQVVSNEDNVEAVLTKVRLGEADAGFVYGSDLASPAKDIRRIDLPASVRPSITYQMAVVRSSVLQRVAAQFVDFVRSPKGQAIFRHFGFTKLSL